MHLKIMTFNIHRAEGMDGRTDLGRIAEVIRRSGADVAALQEVDRYQPRSGWKDQIKLLARELGMQSAFAPSLNLRFLQYGNGLLSRFPILEQSFSFMPGLTERRSVLKVRLSVEGRELTVVNTHLGVAERERRKQVPLLMRSLEEVKGPAVLLGDFNMGAGNRLMKPIEEHWAKVHLQRQMKTLVYGGEIDHVLVTPGITAKAWVTETDASDHYPVTAEMVVHRQG
ncbi:endonuclease/exonuclease/phosphatase family protein [Paenibacillus aurantius]|uniref:Endonuclease/exonuclease/phosphatase family protein n=1 Tax=Paenibacillus aurantius TaxID=2918900 RepID=A0AA96REU5_9BACL|nr:endonuclease/exonuclease/phosphatase family protein [Paenibacillus aurantius]WNQ12835.1 endonuclease/exonuclease/phosphatase family protein [Paenibacillus aurantius]